MRVEGKQTVQVTAAPCKSNPISPVVKHVRASRADNSDLCGKIKKILDEPRRCEDVSLPATGMNNAEEAPDTSSGNSGVGEHDVSISESNAIRQLECVSWRYKNPHSVSINNHTNYEKSTHILENVLKEDEPQEDGVKQSILFTCREYLATYQESCGTPRTEYSFAALIVVMAQAMAQSLLALIYVIVNVAPVVQMFSFILRFILDKTIDIRRTKNIRQVTVKLTIFVVQLLSVYVCLIFILGFIVVPIVQMAIAIATKFAMRN